MEIFHWHELSLKSIAIVYRMMTLMACLVCWIVMESESLFWLLFYFLSLVRLKMTGIIIIPTDTGIRLPFTRVDSTVGSSSLSFHEWMNMFNPYKKKKRKEKIKARRQHCINCCLGKGKLVVKEEGWIERYTEGEGFTWTLLAHFN